MSVTTIDGVVDRLEDIIRRSIAAQDRRGYFAALYNRVTLRVREGVRRGEFEDNARMERLDVVFANRYLDAYDLYAAGRAPTLPWARAFDAARGEGLLVLHHLLLGMIAHIMLDLGIAAVTVAPGRSLLAIERDYLHINNLLAEEIDLVEEQLVEIAGRFDPGAGAALGMADLAGGDMDETLASLLIDLARDRAWDLATDLSRMEERAWAARIQTQEQDTTTLSDAILLFQPVVELLAGGGSRDVAANIRILARGELALTP